MNKSLGNQACSTNLYGKTRENSNFLWGDRNTSKRHFFHCLAWGESVCKRNPVEFLQETKRKKSIRLFIFRRKRERCELRKWMISPIFFSALCDTTSSRSPLYEADLKEIWLYDILDRRDLLSDHRSERRESDGCTMKCDS